MPAKVEMMRCKPCKPINVMPGDISDCVGQEKQDGSRAYARLGEEILLIGKSWKKLYIQNHPEAIAELERIRDSLDKPTELDLELAYVDRNGKVNFLTALSRPESRRALGLKTRLFVFDCMSVDGIDIRNQPLEKRIEIVDTIIPKGLKHVVACETFEDPSKFKSIYAKILADGGEGMVLKRKGSKYMGGEEYRKLGLWRKVKRFDPHDCVICGMTVGNNSRAESFGAIILGQFNDNGKLVHVGNTSGFTQAEIAMLWKMFLPDIPMTLPIQQKLKKINSLPFDCPFDNANEDDIGEILTWVPPNLVAIVGSNGRTPFGMLRQPIFQRLHEDKEPEDCFFD